MKRASASIEMMMISQKAMGNLPIYLKLRCSPPSTPCFSSASISEDMTIFTSLEDLFSDPCFVSWEGTYLMGANSEASRADSCFIFYCLSLFRSM
jgi:hypothetical protein